MPWVHLGHFPPTVTLFDRKGQGFFFLFYFVVSSSFLIRLILIMCLFLLISTRLITFLSLINEEGQQVLPWTSGMIMNEVRRAVMSMKSFKVPGPDDFQPFFFQTILAYIVGKDLCWHMFNKLSIHRRHRRSHTSRDNTCFDPQSKLSYPFEGINFSLSAYATWLIINLSHY